MMSLPDQLPTIADAPVMLPLLFDYSASFLWALSGALLAARRGFVGMGVVIIAIISATGGGLLRDGLLLPADSPALLRNPIYIVIATAAALLVIGGGAYLNRSKFIGPSVHFVDALGAGTYAVVGANVAIAEELPLVGIVIVGVVNAVGGGLLRDVLMRRVPDLFKPGLPFGSASLLAAVLFTAMATQTGIEQTDAALLTIGSVSVLNVVMLRLHVRSRPLEAYREYWDGRD